jgi:amino acid adenylation domain-containing protein
MSICQFLQAHSSKNPASIAIEDRLRQLTYQQLNSRVNQLANYLRKQGIKPDVLVGIYTERSIDSAIAVLGVLQAGGAYVPLDPAYPSDRLTSILAETKLKLVITQQHLAADISTGGINLFLIDTQWAEVAAESEDLTAIPTNPANLAYVMYTSGSTGKPQGVEITIEQVDYYLQAVNEIVQIQPDDIYLLSASFSFSSSIRQLLLPLAQGAKVVIAAKETMTNVSSLLELIQAKKITVFDTVASVWNYILNTLDELEPANRNYLINHQLRTLIFSGGLLTSQLLDRVRSQFPNQSLQVVNIYGQTETIGVCAYVVPDDFNKTEGYAPVGTAYAHNQLYLLDEDNSPVIAGAIGELYVAGKSLARGYLNNSQLNDRKFITNPFGTNRQERLYKTGDLARYLPDGNLEIVGRQDFQVKIRGMRVEIEEIETVLMQHPDVRQAAVVGHRCDSGTAAQLDEPTIVAYIVPNRSPIDIQQLRSFLKTKLTDYALPSAFEILTALPLTPNHKLDRKQLPAPSRKNVSGELPRDEVELQLTQIWEKILKIHPIGIKENFFELGGHSLIALQLFAKIEQVWHKRLSWGILFEAPTIVELAEIIRQSAVVTNWSPLVLLKSGRSRSPLFCVHALGGTLFGYYDLARYLGEDRPIYGLQSRGIDGKQQPLDRVEDIASYYIQSIQIIQPQGPYLLMGYSFGGIVAFEMARQLTAQGELVDFLGLVDTRSPTLDKNRMSLTKWLNFHSNQLKQLQLKDRVKYFFDKILYRLSIQTKGNTEGYKEVMARRLSTFEMFEPELLNVLEANLQATKNYLPQTYPGRATLFWCEYQAVYIDRYPDLGWGQLITGGVNTLPIPGEHLSLLSEPHVRVLAKKLKLCMEQATDDVKFSVK